MDLRRSLRRRAHFWLERRGWHLVSTGPHDPIPDTRLLADVDRRVSELAGIDMREPAQLGLLDELSRYRHEMADLRLPPGFGAVDVEVLYGIVRRYRPRQFIEIRSGASTRATATAMGANEKEGGPQGAITVIDPGAAQELATDARISVRREEATAVPVEAFQRLAPDDVLFIDTSHVLKAGSDVHYLYLDVLPRLPAGSLVHVHDIFLPREYPRSWFTELRFPTEQYLLQAFLAFNESFEVLWSTAYMHHRHAERLAGIFHSYDAAASRQGASFWMRRVK